ncbi:uncharacterized protein FFC1_12650 [Fusarium fujikuroi]|nr:uncharacterized protein FFC1_12650 [Fusarium fujikuroi]
MPFYIPY